MEAAMADHGTFYWNELSTTDIEGAKAFNGSLGGWSFSEMPMANGAAVLMAPFDVPGVGRICTLRDPQGAEISIMTPAAKE
jgi:predicted enzyme related to lactoylglutathione lyase